MFLFGDKVRYNIVVPCDQGTFIVNRFDYTTMPTGEKVGQGQWLMDHGNVSTPEAMLTGERLKDTKAPVIFDIGANIGTYSSLIGTMVPNSTIYAFEPQRLVFQQFCGNMAINNLDNVKNPTKLESKNGEIPIIPSVQSLSSIIFDNTQKITDNLTTISTQATIYV
jgi:hypothetical protein